jgi:hypothetical protein
VGGGGRSPKHKESFNRNRTWSRQTISCDILIYTKKKRLDAKRELHRLAVEGAGTTGGRIKKGAEIEG